ncbi:MAG: hypothetical protein P4L28_02240 [Paludibacteraceae bacterium]|nr:hypothetical protein [Paludibacteraceae bacterium]
MNAETDFNDKLSFDYKEQNKYQDNELYSIYFRDLYFCIDPTIKEGFKDLIKFSNCSDNFTEILNNYLEQNHNGYGRNSLLSLLLHMGNDLVYKGRVVFEFVSSFSEDETFKAFELVRLDPDFCLIKRNKVLFKAPDYNGNEKKVVIPKSKCIIINFPKQLGGYRGYQNVVYSVFKIGSKFLDSGKFDVYKSTKHMKEWDKNFNKIVSKWGNIHLENNTTEYYNVINDFRLKKTQVYCILALIDGLNNIVIKLNEKLHERAKVVFSSDVYDIDKVLLLEKKWEKGELSFDEVRKITSLR